MYTGLCTMSPLLEMQGLSNALWCLGRVWVEADGTCSLSDEQLNLVDAAANALLDLLPKAKAQDVANSLWALGRLWGASITHEHSLSKRQQLVVDALADRMRDVLPTSAPQSITNSVWACGAMLYSPLGGVFLEGVDKYIATVYSGKHLSGWVPEDVCQFLLGCARLRFIPSDATCDAMLARTATALDSYSPQSISSILMAAAVLQLPIDRALVTRMLQRLLLRLDETNVQNVCNALWGSVALQVYERELAARLAAWVEGRLGSVVLEGQTQLLQTHMAYDLLAPPREKCTLLSPGVVQSWQHAVEERQQQGATDSRLQRSVLKAARALLAAWDVQGEGQIDGHMFHVDIVATCAKGTKLIVEVDGPSHFAANEPTRELGHTVLRNRMLRALGYVVVPVPYWGWRRAPDQSDYLQQLLNAHLVV